MIFLTHQHYFDYSKGQNLSQIEHEILAFLLSDSQNEHPCSIRVVAKELTTSTVTIIRLCKKLGFSGYTAFTEKLRLEYTDHSPTEATQLLSANLNTHFTRYMKDYQDTLDTLSIRDATVFTQSLTTSHVVQLIGDDSDAFITYIATKLQSKGFRVLVSSNKDTLFSFETKLNETTLMLIFNRHSATESLLKKIDYAKEKKVVMIGFLGSKQPVNFRQLLDAQFEIRNEHSQSLHHDAYDSAVIMIFDVLMSLVLDSVK
ncbi:MurR/RpiR family transcriptional regulator [Carnobacterium maltaromaticum]|uniref:MurR/RpiR family transcriptional regulator n=1 Tax=Carnobacterium maltaromaticum TaxID=2751 RepID=UPI000C763DE5|nr:MurR/RpiR family transcriptional regulator [Carnobacterium maltaromaticum]PLS33140.1 MurR/RpiR family transcriptional regulator [Carnobacterium maltaromaticum]PLS33715.1 MurR/RpiR family transcriptional regulator [Carnobacterium maltaromaticum]PLS33910.1 MurR/RpiR family transcriptional regulator [Carnobacterium maltaromaticum]PLS41249.1 MurR/RpiR family transcriptional regulator [Carnobacterium maltaromaticum]PLS42296.1 MurR/RpiR family transcriptional regulator [Carnobacterium maltaromati